MANATDTMGPEGLLVDTEVARIEADHWYGFVESVDPFSAPRVATKSPAWWRRVLVERSGRKMIPPDRIVWLSCIRAEYFYSLPWRNEPCETGNIEQAELRRQRLLSLEPAELTIVGLLLGAGSDHERWAGAEAEGHDWHRFRLSSNGDIPVVVGPEFDFGEDAQLTGFDHLGGVAESELRALRAVFNLDFLPDAELGGDLEGEPPTPVLAPGPGGASQAKDMIAVYQRLKQKYQT